MEDDRAPSELVNAAEIARRLDLSQERVRQLANAGTVPPPSGVVGRNKVWRWDHVESWAVATGRLARPDDRDLRRPPSIWLDSKRPPMDRTVDDVVDAGRAGQVHVRVWQTVDGSGRPAVVLGQLDSERALTHGIEHAAETVIERWLGPGGVDADWFEYLPPSDFGPGEFDVVTFDATDSKRRRSRRTTKLSNPAWFDVSHAQLEAFIGAPVEVYEEGTYNAGTVTAYAAVGGRTRVPMVWDPEGLSDDVAAAGDLADLLALESGNELWAVALRAITGPADGKRDRIREDIAAQDSAAPVMKVEPSFDAAAWDLVEQWGTGTQDPDGHRAQLDTAVGLRRWLMSSDPASAARLRPGPDGTLAWRLRGDTAVTSFDDDVEEAGQPVSAVRLAEHVLTSALRRDCDWARDVDVCSSVPSTALPTKDQFCLRYLDTVSWWGPAAGDEPWAAQLENALDAKGGRFGYDPWGRRVLAGKSDFVVDWPTLANSSEGAVGAKVCSSPGVGGQPVFIALPDGRLDLLAASPGTGFAPEFTWGYSGEGPSNLARALLEFVLSSQSWSPSSHEERHGAYVGLLDLIAGLHGPLHVPFEALLATVEAASRSGGRAPHG